MPAHCRRRDTKVATNCDDRIGIPITDQFEDFLLRFGSDHLASLREDAGDRGIALPAPMPGSL